MLETYEGRRVVISSLVGSWAYNLNTPYSDKDWKYFVVPTFDDLYSGKMFASAKISVELDFDVHDIRKLPEQLWKSNLNFIGVLFGYEMHFDYRLQWIQLNSNRLASMNLPYFYNATMGMHHEKMGALLKGTSTTQELVNKFGYDTKQACHAMRCLLVLERVANGMSVREALWFNGNPRQYLIDIKEGAFNLFHFRDLVESWHTGRSRGVSAWFKKQQPVPELHAELNQLVKEFIRLELR